MVGNTGNTFTKPDRSQSNSIHVRISLLFQWIVQQLPVLSNNSQDIYKHQEHSSQKTALSANFFHHLEKYIQNQNDTLKSLQTVIQNTSYSNSLLNITIQPQHHTSPALSCPATYPFIHLLASFDNDLRSSLHSVLYYTLLIWVVRLFAGDDEQSTFWTKLKKKDKWLLLFKAPWWPEKQDLLSHATLITV